VLGDDFDSDDLDVFYSFPGTDAGMTKAIQDYKSPTHKIIAFLKKGRDDLRQKYSDLRVELRRAQNQVRAVTKSRQNWELRARSAEVELDKLKKSNAPDGSGHQPPIAKRNR
jgi:predicted  nucleic acid-binding Zn-ribbon protein